MVKIFEALERAERERTGERTAGTITPPKDIPRGQSLRQKLIAVCRNIESSVPEKKSRVVTFVGARPGEGTSTLVREFAKVASTDLGRRVVLVDVEHGLGGHHHHFGVKMNAGFEEVVANRSQLEDVLQPVQGESMFLGCVVTSEASVSSVVADLRFDDVIKRLREEADLVLFDAPPIIPVTDAGLLGAQTDGVIMVIQTNRTQRGVVKHGEGLLKQAQAKLLGYILTNVQYHIPGYIYRYL